ncbi:Long-chain-fatty-acid--CoA ligase FadD15 [compost metagenome]
MTAVCESLARRVAPARVEQHLTLLPLATLLENLTGLYVPLLTGACSRIPSLGELGFTGSSTLNPAMLGQALARWPSHSLVLVPELLRLLLALCANTPALAERLKGLRFVAVGGGKVAPELIAHARALGLPVYEGYGLSECGSVVALNGPDADRPAELLRLLLALCANTPALAERLKGLRFVAVGGGKVAPALIAHARALGLPVYEGYGLSECSSVVALNGPDDDRPGSVGRPLPHCHVTLAADGEVMVSGSAMLGYLGEEAPATPTIATGDLGHLDAEGYLHITGRKKNVQITAFGRNFSPEWVEAQAQLCPAIVRIVIFGDGQPANVALIQPLPGTQFQLAEQIARLNQQLPDYARIHHWLPVALDQHPGLLTANGRPRRNEIYHHFSRQIDQCLTQGLTGETS